MRNLITLLCLILLAPCAMAKSSSKVPDSITNIFMAQYDNASIKKLKLSKDTVSIKFVKDKKTHIAYYSKNGRWIKTTTKIWGTWNLPVAVKQGFFKSAYKTWYIRSIREEDTADKKVFIFNMDNSSLLDSNHIANFLEKNYLYFDESGRQLQVVNDPT